MPAAPSRHRPPSPTRAVAMVAGGLVALLAVTMTAAALSHSSTRSSSAAAVTWDGRAGNALHPLATELAPVAHDVATWQQSGSPATGSLRSELATAGAVFAGVHAAVAALPPSPAGHLVNDLYLRSVELDQAWVQVTDAAAATPPGPLATQLVLAGTRLRELGDRVFDRGRAPLARLVPATTVPGVDVVRPADVPDWPAEGLEAGPPLALTVPDAHPGQPSVRAPVRPEQPRAAWLSAVAAARLPPTAAIDTAVHVSVHSAGQQASLEMAGELEAAEARLFALPDPAADREGAARFYLGLLAQAESLRLAAAGPAVDVSGPADTLLAVGAELRAGL